MTLIILTSILALSLVPGGLASPTGIRVRSDADTCVSQCRKNWGWPGHPFSNDPWGSVVHPKLSSASSDPGLGVGGVEAAPSADTDTPVPTEIFTTSPVIVSYSAAPIPTSAGITSSPSITSFTPPPPLPTTSKRPPPPPPSPKPVSPSPKPAPPPPKAAPPPPPPQAVGSGSGSTRGATSQSDIQAYLAGHNNVRARHGAAPLSYSQDLAAKAQQWANGCKFVHSGGSLGPFGENLAAGTGDSYGIAEALKSWTDEASDYNPGNPQPSHFTQVVWKGTTQVGCALQMCDGIFASSFGKARYYVCEYSRQGNVIGDFDQNVQA